MVQQKDYFAFISYKREDKKEAKWLQHALEYYRLPNHLRKDNPGLPEYVRPVFRDMTDLEVGELSAQIHAGLEQSHFLIVVCSPRAAKSKWVNDEIEYFISLGKQDMIIPYIIEGVPHAFNADEECYPPSLLELSKKNELLGANINEVGRDSATIRIVSRMFNIRFDTLFQRYQREQRKTRLRKTIAIVLFFLFILTVSGWIWRQNKSLKDTVWNMMIAQSRAVAEKANQILNEGDSFTARKLAVAVLPSRFNPNRPFVQEAETILRKAYENDNCILRGHTAPVSSLSFSPQKDMLVSGSSDGVARLWDITTGKQVQEYRMNSQRIDFVSFDSDGETILTSSSTNICVWSARGDLEWPINQIGVGPERITSVMFGPQKGSILFTTSNHVCLWNFLNSSAPEILRFPHMEILSATVSPDGSTIIALNSNNVIFSLDIKSNKILYQISGHSFPLLFDSQLFQNDSILAFGNKDGTITLWNYRTGEHNSWIGHNSEISGVCVSSKGDRIASLSRGGDIRIWDVDSKALLLELLCDSSDLSIAFIENAPLNAFEILGMNPDGSFYFKIIDSISGVVINKTNLPYALGMYGICTLNRDGTKLAVSTLSGEIIIKDLSTNGFEPKESLGVIVSRDRIDIDDSNILFGDDYSFMEYEIKDSIDRLYQFHVEDSIRFLRFQPKTEHIITVTNHCIYGFDNGLVTSKTPLNEGITDITYTPDGQSLVAICDNDIVFLNSETMEEYRRFNVVKEGYHNRAPLHIKVDHDRIITWNIVEPSIRVWDFVHGSQTDVIEQMYPLSISFSEDGNIMAIGDLTGNIYVYDFTTTEKRLLKDGHHKIVRNLRFSPDQKKLISCSSDNSIIVWDITSAQSICKYELDDVIDVSFSSSGKMLFAITQNGTIYTKEFIPTKELIEQTMEKFADNPLTSEELRDYFIK